MYGTETQRLLPTDLGRITNDFLVEHFPSILSYDFTASEEEQFDRIAVGKADWTKTVDSFYKTFQFYPSYPTPTSWKTSDGCRCIPERISF